MFKAQWQRQHTALSFRQSARASRIIANSVNPIICRLHFYVSSDKQMLISDAPGLRGNKRSLGLIPVGVLYKLLFMMKPSGSLRNLHVFWAWLFSCRYILFYKHVNVHISFSPPPLSLPCKSALHTDECSALGSGVSFYDIPLISGDGKFVEVGRRIKALRPTFDISEK